jgi:flavin reductase (DIM6/NTAB) family NADH-FMN oxidoreductase RutF
LITKVKLKKIKAMKKNGLCMIILFGILAACSNGNKKVETAVNVAVDVKDKAFNELFTSVKETEIEESVFKLVGKDWTIITSGDSAHYNSMVASWGGWGILFEKPVTWCFLRSSRYTLELIKKHHTYTMTYFDDSYKKDIMLFGTKSGRDSNKMKETVLTAIQTPSGNLTYKEAKLIIECTLVELTTVSPDDFLAPSSKEFIVDAYEETNEYHKLVFGEITGVWVKK